MKTLLAAICACSFAVSLAAADVNGKWEAIVETRRGEQQITFEFQADGEELTGSVSNQFFGDLPIQDGRIEGDQISFKQLVTRRDREITIVYSGKISGNEIEFTRGIEGGGPGGGGQGGRGPEAGPGGGRGATFTATRVQ